MFILADVMHGSDVSMVQFCRSARLCEKARWSGRIGACGAAKKFERYRSLELGVPREVHVARRTLAEMALQLVSSSDHVIDLMIRDVACVCEDAEEVTNTIGSGEEGCYLFGNIGRNIRCGRQLSDTRLTRRGPELHELVEEALDLRIPLLRHASIIPPEPIVRQRLKLVSIQGPPNPVKYPIPGSRYWNVRQQQALQHALLRANTQE